MSELDSRWKGDPPELPPSRDAETLIRIAADLGGRTVEIDWVFSKEELKALRRAVYRWGRYPVARFKKFHAELVGAMNRVLGSSSVYRDLKPPAGSAHLDSGASVEARGDSLHLLARADFAVIFGVGWGAYRCLNPRGEFDRTVGGLADETVWRRIVAAVEQLGWPIAPLDSPEGQRALSALFNYRAHDWEW